MAFLPHHPLFPLPAAPYSLLAQRFLNNPEKTMSGAALFGLALVSGSKAVFALAVFSHLSHWWFLSYVEGYVRSLLLLPFPLPTAPSICIF